MARTQKNKATNYHLGRLKGKLAMLRSQLIAESKTSGKAGEGFDVARSGDARVAMIGFPSVGKSTLLSTLTNTKSEAASYAFTTLTCIPGVVEYNEAKIQLLDLPGIIEGASRGKGRGKQVIAVGRTSDLILMVVEADKAELQMKLLTKELDDVGIRINQEKPDIAFVAKKTGGIKFNSTCELTHCDEKMCREILHLHKVHNADILFRGDYTVDQFIDVIEGNRKYMRCLYVINKVDTITTGEMDRLARLPDTVVIGCHWKLNLDLLLEKTWEYLDVVRVYTKPRGSRPDFSDPVIMARRKSSILDLCNHIHRDFSSKFKSANVWGTSAKHTPQSVGIRHELQDEDVVQLMTKSGAKNAKK